VHLGVGDRYHCHFADSILDRKHCPAVSQ
jgi:hypothetical protein